MKCYQCHSLFVSRQTHVTWREGRMVRRDKTYCHCGARPVIDYILPAPTQSTVNAPASPRVLKGRVTKDAPMDPYAPGEHWS